MGVQRQCQRSAYQGMAGEGCRRRGRGFEPPRQVALHDVSAAQAAAKVDGRGWRYFYQH